MNREKLIAKCEVVSQMSDQEGVKVLAEVLQELLENIDKTNMGFKNEKTDNNR